jgi:hypothetical protein
MTLSHSVEVAAEEEHKALNLNDGPDFLSAAPFGHSNAFPIGEKEIHL